MNRNSSHIKWNAGSTQCYNVLIKLLFNDILNFQAQAELFAFSHLLIKAETLLSLGSKGHFPFPESTLPGSRRKMYSWNGRRFKGVIRKCHFPPPLVVGKWGLVFESPAWKPLGVHQNWQWDHFSGTVATVSWETWLKNCHRATGSAEGNKKKCKQHTKPVVSVTGRCRKTLRTIQKPVRRVPGVSGHQLIIPQCKRTSWTSVSTLARLGRGHFFLSDTFKVRPLRLDRNMWAKLE